MGGKGALFLVIGFSLIFVVIGRNISNISVRAYDNAMKYYVKTNAYYTALAGANIAASKVFFDNSWREGYDDIEYNGGEYSVDIKTIDPVREIIKITSVGTFGDGGLEETHTVEVKLQPSSFSRYGYFSNKEKIGNSTIWWTSKDTVWGPFHTNDKIRIYGDPVFMGKASSYKGIHKYRGSNPEFNGGYSRSSEELSIPDDGIDNISTAAQNDGLYFSGQDTVILDFKGDSLNFRYGANKADTTVYLPDATNNGTIFANAATIRMKGVIDGKYTVAASQETVTATSGYWKWNRRKRKYKWKKTTTKTIKGGKIYLDDDVVYKDDPRLGPSDDILGIVAEQEIYITDNAANAHDINIQAAMFSQEKGFGSENYSSRPSSGYINLLGGITQESRMAVGTFSSYGISHGFSKRYRYDDRLMVMSPPFFPGTGNFEVVSWYE
ncbi:MAG: DUF4900 domain-containing protein [Chlorobi bacterium]|nr:DUF4900 domain-containing protein [Chlorobiota bacterium]